MINNDDQFEKSQQRTGHPDYPPRQHEKDRNKEERRISTDEQMRKTDENDAASTPDEIDTMMDEHQKYDDETMKERGTD